MRDKMNMKKTQTQLRPFFVLMAEKRFLKELKELKDGRKYQIRKISEN